MLAHYFFTAGFSLAHYANGGQHVCQRKASFGLRSSCQPEGHVRGSALERWPTILRRPNGAITGRPCAGRAALHQPVAGISRSRFVAHLVRAQSAWFILTGYPMG
jgi:hypothetical protein